MEDEPVEVRDGRSYYAKREHSAYILISYSQGTVYVQDEISDDPNLNEWDIVEVDYGLEHVRVVQLDGTTVPAFDNREKVEHESQ